MNDRAVVLCRTAAGMRAATWLAQRGVAVRVLCTEPEVPVDDVSLVAGPKERVTSLAGPVDAAEPVLQLWHGGRVHPLPTTKRQLATIAHDGRRGAAMGELALGRVHRGPTAEDWVRRWLGGRVWTTAVHGWLDQRLAGPGARAPAGVARHLLGSPAGGWWRPRWSGAERAQRRIGRILDSGGEVLDGVRVEALEVEHGRIVGVQTEFGFDGVEGVLLTDLPPAEVAGLLSGDERPVVPTPPLGDRVRVVVEGQLPGDAMLVLDGVRRLVQLVQVAGGVAADAVIAPGEPLYSASDLQLGAAMRERMLGLVPELGAVVRVERASRCVTCPRPSAEAPWEPLVHRYASLGVQPLGETGWLLPVSWLDELGHLEQFAEGTVVATQRARWLRDGPPAEPWSPMVQA